MQELSGRRMHLFMLSAFPFISMSIPGACGEPNERKQERDDWELTQCWRADPMR
ncbi:hypothetical protein PPMP20_29685 [Paraburkholderia phymatum]|uniref:hypothetical protein n=1 Tax=Paraburkholderia phymatum TaxID=148447 RepID=UPI0012FE786B|nr:hypothetical protein [Paraburkholderia phymatum]